MVHEVDGEGPVLIMTTAKRVAYRHIYARMLVAMSMADALETLGFRPGDSPRPDDVKRAQRKLTVEHHPDRGGDPRKQVEINVAADILLGKERPSGGLPAGGGGYSGPSYGGPSRKEPDQIVTFDEAKTRAGIPPGADWLFVTTYHRSGYSSDEFTNRAVGWVAVSQSDNAWSFTTVENLWKEAYVPGVPDGKKDIWRMSTHKVPKGGPVTARFFYGEVLKAWKRFQHMEKRFNSKVVGAEGWKFSENPPKGNTVSIKNFLLNSGMMGEEALGDTPRKYEIKVHYSAAKFDERKNPPSGYFSPKYSDPYQLTLIINGKDFIIPERALAKLDKLDVKGKDFMKWMFGEYYYGGETKVLTRKREGKQVMAWMVENLPGLPEWVTTALTVASTAKPATTRRRRW